MADKNTFARERHHEDMHLQAEKAKKKEDEAVMKEMWFPTIITFRACGDILKMKHIFSWENTDVLKCQPEIVIIK